MHRSAAEWMKRAILLNLEAAKHQELDQERASAFRGGCALCFGWTWGTGAVWGIDNYSPEIITRASSALGFTKAEPREGDIIRGVQ